MPISMPDKKEIDRIINSYILGRGMTTYAVFDRFP